jgi:hypothetical protein
MLVLTPARRESQDEVDVESDALLGGATAETATATLVADSAATERGPDRRARTDGSFGDPAHGRCAHDGDSGAVAGDHRRQPKPAARRSGGFGEALRALEAPGREPRLPNIGFASREDLLDPPVDPRLRGVGNVIDDHGTLGACCFESHSGFVFPAPSGYGVARRREQQFPTTTWSLLLVGRSAVAAVRRSHREPRLAAGVALEHAYRPSATRPRSRRPRCLMVRGRILAVALGRGAAFSLGFSAVALGALAVTAHRCAAHEFASRP